MINNRISDDISLHINCYGMGDWLQETFQKLGVFINNNRDFQSHERVQLLSTTHYVTLTLYPLYDTKCGKFDYDNFVLERASFSNWALPPFGLDPFADTEASAAAKLSHDYGRGQMPNKDQTISVSYFLKDARVIVPSFRQNGPGFSQVLVVRLGIPLDWRQRSAMPEFFPP